MEFKELIKEIKSELNDATSANDSARNYIDDATDALQTASDYATDADTAINNAYDLIKEIEEYNINQMTNTQLAEELAARLDRLPAADDDQTNTVIRSVKLSLNAIIQLMKQFKLG